MKSRQRTLRIMLSGILLMATLACGVYAYRYESNKQEEAQIESAKKDDQKQEETQTEEPTEDVNTDNAEAQVPAETQKPEQTDKVNENQPADTPAPTEAPAETPAADADADTTASDAVLPALEFNEGTLLNLPLSGEIVIPYNMDNTVYFSTLNLYRCNPAVMIAAEIDTPVAVVANSQVTSITEDAVTGTTVTMDMGNGYQAVYGQLKDITVEQGQTVAAGTVIGNVNAPTKYFTKEGSNLYFAMTKDGTPIDPSLYLPSEAE